VTNTHVPFGNQPQRSISVPSVDRNIDQIQTGAVYLIKVDEELVGDWRFALTVVSGCPFRLLKGREPASLYAQVDRTK